MSGRETITTRREIRENMITESMLTEREITGNTIIEEITIRGRKRGERTARDGRADGKTDDGK